MSEVIVITSGSPLYTAANEFTEKSILIITVSTAINFIFFIQRTSFAIT